eukprot:jgi/Chrzof1/13653/Cz08g06100.t1
MRCRGLVALVVFCATAAVLVGKAEGLGFAKCSIRPSGAYVSQPNATIWGQEIMIAFGSGFRPEMGAIPGRTWPWMAAFITGIVMCALSCRAYLQVQHTRND